MTFRFGDYELDEAAFELRRAGQPVALEPQVVELICHLVEHRDRLVSKNELLDEVWGDRFVSESTLTSRIKVARQALGDDGRRQAMIRTIHGRGYRFVGELRADDATEPGSIAAPPPGPREAGSPTDWPTVAAHYAAADRTTLSTDDLSGWATAAWWTCQLDLALELRQEAFRRTWRRGTASARRWRRSGSPRTTTTEVCLRPTRGGSRAPSTCSTASPTRPRTDGSPAAGRAAPWSGTATPSSPSSSPTHCSPVPPSSCCRICGRCRCRTRRGP